MLKSIAKSVLATVALAAVAAAVQPDRVVRQVRHHLITLPYYTVFDNFTFRVDGSRVTLGGQVTRPTLRADAERAVGRIPGVAEVANEIEVLPVSPNDDRIRRAAFRAIYGQPALSRYAMQAVPPIHIVVKNGNVTLEGVVATEGEKNIAALQANGVAGVFAVVNNLATESAE